jgi:uncharacterized coiled-coil DUF342 family protein
MATELERISIVEVKVENLNEKIDDLKVGVKDMHDCLDRTRDEITDHLKTMQKTSYTQSQQISAKIAALEKMRDKWTWIAAGSVATVGVLTGHAEKLLKFIL